MDEESKAGDPEGATDEKVEWDPRRHIKVMLQSDDVDGNYDAGDEEDGGGAQ